jgi:hypothetical protein
VAPNDTKRALSQKTLASQPQWSLHNSSSSRDASAVKAVRVVRFDGANDWLQLSLPSTNSASTDFAIDLAPNDDKEGYTIFLVAYAGGVGQAFFDGVNGESGVYIGSHPFSPVNVNAIHKTVEGRDEVSTPLNFQSPPSELQIITARHSTTDRKFALSINGQNTSRGEVCLRTRTLIV